MKGVKLCKGQVDTLVRLFSEGKSIKQIATATGFGESTVDKYIRSVVGKRGRKEHTVPGKNSVVRQFKKEMNPLMGRMASVSLKVSTP